MENEDKTKVPPEVLLRYTLEEKMSALKKKETALAFVWNPLVAYPRIDRSRLYFQQFRPYSKLHKRTCPDDVKICDMLFETFGPVDAFRDQSAAH